MPDYIYDRETGLYRNRGTGAYVSPAKVSAWVEEVVDKSKQRMGAIARLRQIGEINDAEWVTMSADEIKALHRAVGMIGAGGRAQMTLQDWGSVGNRIRREIEYLHRFASEVDNIPEGAVLTDAFVSRAKSYADSAYATYEQAVRRRILRDGLADEEENKLERGANHCDGCRAATSAGRVPVGTLVPVGDRDCGSKCRCRIKYYRSDKERMREVDYLQAPWFEAQQEIAVA